MLIVSNYDQRSDLQIVPLDGINPETFPVSAKGTVFIPALRVGFSCPVGARLSIDFGAQKALKPNRDDLFGSPARNYQPGAGVGERFLFNRPYLQGYFALKWEIGRL